MTLKTLTIALVCGTAQAGYSISSMLTTRRKKTPGTAGSIRGLISSRAAQEILLEELQVEVGYHMQVRRVEIHVLVEECDHEQQCGH